MKNTLLSEGSQGAFEKKILIFDDVEKIRVLSNPVAWKILKLLSKKPMYPAQVAKEIKIYEQSAYYYIRKLVAIGALEEAGSIFVRGGTAMLYQASSPAFGIQMDWGEKKVEALSLQKKFPHALKFFNEFFVNESFKGLIVVGAPDPHGPYKSSARDGHYGVHLSYFLGAITRSFPSEFVVKLDTDAKAEKAITGNNLIVIGGPGTNIVTAEFNKYLPVKFDEANFWSGLVDKSGKRYNSDNHGVIAKIKHPYDGKSSIIAVAGVRSLGTKSAVIALTNYSEQVLKNYKNEEECGLVVQGFDMNSDGKIDHVDVVGSL